MKKQILCSLLLCNMLLRIDGQIYTPDKSIDGSSGSTNVGIGIIPDQAKLHVLGDYNLRIEPSSGSSTYYYITTNSANNIIGTNIRTKVGAWNVPDKTQPSAYIDFSTYSINNPTYGGITFLTRSAGDQSDLGSIKMSMLNNGYVGIGITNPQNKLDVNGTIHAKEVKVDLTGWSDFVFQSSYQLKSLKDLEQYINLYGHLPEIPSAEEVEQNGVNVGQIQAKLLQKIEELTLYVIDLKKESEQKDKQITEQERKYNQLESEMQQIKKQINSTHP
jgi:hypothetical protein